MFFALCCKWGLERCRHLKRHGQIHTKEYFPVTRQRGLNERVIRTIIGMSQRVSPRYVSFGCRRPLSKTCPPYPWAYYLNLLFFGERKFTRLKMMRMHGSSGRKHHTLRKNSQRSLCMLRAWYPGDALVHPWRVVFMRRWLKPILRDRAPLQIGVLHTT